MYDASLMRVLKCLRDLNEHGNDLEITRATESTQIAAGSKLHG